MRPALALALLAAAGCPGFETPGPPETSRLLLSMPPPGAPFIRLKVRMTIDSPALAGVFDGVIVLRTGTRPAVRAQFFPDLGGKVIDLLARPDRITGYFPLQKEGIDLALPEEARLHPLSMIGVTLLEHAAALQAGRVTGVRGGDEGPWYRIAGAAPGVELTLQLRGEFTVRQFAWKHGVQWCETSSSTGATVAAPGLSVRLDILERQHPDPLPESLFELALPAEVRR